MSSAWMEVNTLCGVQCFSRVHTHGIMRPRGKNAQKNNRVCPSLCHYISVGDKISPVPGESTWFYHAIILACLCVRVPGPVRLYVRMICSRIIGVTIVCVSCLLFSSLTEYLALLYFYGRVHLSRRYDRIMAWTTSRSG